MKKFTVKLNFDSIPSLEDFQSCHERIIESIESFEGGHVGTILIERGIFVDVMNNEMDEELRRLDLEKYGPGRQHYLKEDLKELAKMIAARPVDLCSRCGATDRQLRLMTRLIESDSIKGVPEHYTSILICEECNQLRTEGI